MAQFSKGCYQGEGTTTRRATVADCYRYLGRRDTREAGDPASQVSITMIARRRTPGSPLHP